MDFFVMFKFLCSAPLPETVHYTEHLLSEGQIEGLGGKRWYEYEGLLLSWYEENINY